MAIFQNVLVREMLLQGTAWSECHTNIHRLRVFVHPNNMGHISLRIRQHLQGRQPNFGHRFCRHVAGWVVVSVVRLLRSTTFGSFLEKKKKQISQRVREVSDVSRLSFSLLKRSTVNSIVKNLLPHHGLLSILSLSLPLGLPCHGRPVLGRLPSP